MPKLDPPVNNVSRTRPPPDPDPNYPNASSTQNTSAPDSLSGPLITSGASTTSSDASGNNMRSLEERVNNLEQGLKDLLKFQSELILYALLARGFKPNLVDEAAEARCAQPILQDFVKSELAHDCPVAETARGYLNEAAKLNAPRPSQHPTDSPSRVNTTTPCARRPSMLRYHPLAHLALNSWIAYSKFHIPS